MDLVVAGCSCEYVKMAPETAGDAECVEDKI